MSRLQLSRIKFNSSTLLMKIPKIFLALVTLNHLKILTMLPLFYYLKILSMLKLNSSTLTTLILILDTLA